MEELSWSFHYNLERGRYSYHGLLRKSLRNIFKLTWPDLGRSLFGVLTWSEVTKTGLNMLISSSSLPAGEREGGAPPSSRPGYHTSNNVIYLFIFYIIVVTSHSLLLNLPAEVLCSTGGEKALEGFKNNIVVDSGLPCSECQCASVCVPRQVPV